MKIPARWPRLLEVVQHPETILGLQGPGWDDLLKDIRGNGLFPMAYRALKENGCLGRLEPARRAEVEQAMVNYRAGWAAAWDEIDRVLAIFVDHGLHPIPLKGADLSMRAYPAPHLRPLTDLDVLFPTLKEADRAYDLLGELGYRYEGLGIEGDPWALCHQRSAVEHFSNKFVVEVHGALVWAPKDDRWTGGACRLMEGREAFVYKGFPLEGLAPEANVVFLCAHMFLQHASESPKAVVLYDLRFVVERAGERFNWDSVLRLARVARFQTPVYEGLALARNLLGVPVPDGTLEALAAEAEVKELPPEAWVAQVALGQVAHAAGVWGSARMAWNYLFPSRAFLRVRYPERARWPVWLLYPYRWWDQAGKVVKWARAR